MPRKLISVAIDSLRPTPEQLAEIDQGVVDRIAESLPLEGLREPIVVTPRRHIIHGVHRYLAAKKAGLAVIECVEEGQSATIEEHSAKVIVENFARKQLSLEQRNDLRVELVKLREKRDPHPQEKTQQKPVNTPRGNSIGKVGRPPTRDLPPAEAIEDVAEKTGTNAKALREATWRRKVAAENTRVEKSPAEPTYPLGEVEAADGSTFPARPPVAPPIEDERGGFVPVRLQSRWELRRRLIDEIGANVRQINTKLGELGKDFPQNWTQEMGQVKAAWGQIRLKRPFAVCLVCKGADVPECSGCHGLGLLSEADTERLEKHTEELVEEVPF